MSRNTVEKHKVVALWCMGVGAGWRQLVEPLVKRCIEEGVEIQQVKEKFGGLRFYTGGVITGSELDKMIDNAEAKSLHTCEECGKPGKLRSFGWQKTLCDQHAAEREAEEQARIDKYNASQGNSK